MDQSADPLQRYRALPDGCIRLLSIQPSAHRDAQVECHLSPVRIDERPYEALSYVWGQEDATHGILVDAEKVLVRSNLYGALKELRLTDQPRMLWVDSICINQSDIAERNHQVRQMGAIYSSATQVVVWLGEGDDATDVALDFVQGLSKLDPDTARRIVDNEGLPWEHRQRVFHALGMRHGLDNYDGVVGGLAKLMDHVWWTRVWTVQEIVLARSAILRCGAKSASWSHLSKLAAFALEVSHHNTLSFGRPMDEAVFDEMTARVSKLYAATGALNDLSYRVAHGLDIHLEQMAWTQLLTRQATDPLDVIYALLGLSTEKTTIEIDYGKSKKHVYTSAIKAMFERDRNPHPLHFLQDCYVERDATLPSWVPDFGTLHSFKTINLATTGIGTALTLGSLYNASLGDADWNPPKFLDDDDYVLQMEGVSVDEVRNIGDVCPRFPDGWERREAQLRAIIDQWRQLVPKTEDEYIGGGSVVEAFWRTVTFDLLLTDRDYLAGNPNRRDTRLPKGAAGMPPTTAEEEAEVREGIVDAPPPKTVLEKLGERRFFVTKAGYFGLGPAYTQAGDIACVLRGALFPTVVRPTTNHRYTMVGECFVHGIMDGEMIDSVNKGRSSRQSFSFV
ncbi:heterokaryon incompatibility protein-domain-containing protein [Dactylonectria estremocensis]|uniref:Heterokaryon incompatibility protein-domain-containing protein n=1 Tax=Dactylonectria estremocensis TaxID=1079267 RepID=A0A9P9E2H5_9HYPO|nr:heterokaryon incompatibility protein-domain-containing protein [Dactylonectria estremocensis]